MYKKFKDGWLVNEVKGCLQLVDVLVVVEQYIVRLWAVFKSALLSSSSQAQKRFIICFESESQNATTEIYDNCSK